MNTYHCFTDAERTWIGAWLLAAVDRWLYEDWITLEDAMEAAVEDADWDLGAAFPTFFSTVSFDDDLTQSILISMKDELGSIVSGDSIRPRLLPWEVADNALGSVNATGLGREELELLLGSFEQVIGRGDGKDVLSETVSGTERAFEARFPNFARGVAFSAETRAMLRVRTTDLLEERAAAKSPERD
jgi:hypothetical protein